MTDQHRPRFHFTPEKNWMNDPIPFFWNGAYHVYFQHNPGEPVWGDMHWGHAVSRDLIHWKELPIALAPSPGGPDADGVFTGGIIEHGGTFYAFYTGIPQLGTLQQVQCLATSRDLIVWEKYAGNPVIAARPDGFGDCFRDPHLWREGDRWRMLIGGEQAGRIGGAALLYESSDLLTWDYLHPLVLSDITQTGHECECPDFFPLDGKYVFVSSSSRTWWQTGIYDGKKFTSEHLGPADTAAFYAAKTLQDVAGRRLLFGWLREERPESEQREAGWSGALSLPRLLSVLPDGTLGQEPPPELEALRGRHRHFSGLTVIDGVLVLDGITGDSLELRVEFAPGSAAQAGLSVYCTADGMGGAEFLYDLPAASPSLSLRVFADRSVLEVFADGRCETRRVYPPADQLSVALLARGGAAQVVSVDVWELAT